MDQDQSITKKNAQKPGRDTNASGKKYEGLTEEEREAMKEHLAEQRAAARRNPQNRKEEEEKAVLAKIAEMTGLDRQMAERIHAIVKENAPVLSPRLWYGMPAYALDGKVVCFFQAADKFKARYATIGFNDTANLDEGFMWPASFALTGLTPAEEKKIADLVKKAVS